MIALLSSPRLRRRLFWSCALVAAAVAAAALVIALPGGRRFSDDSAAPSGRFEPVAPTVAPQRRMRVTPKIRREVNATLVPFIRHAVARERPELAWSLVTPALRTGTTRAEWRRGDIPVFPFPARPEEASGWRVLEAFDDDLLISLLVHARPGTNEGAIAFQIELKRVGRGSNGRWLVDSLIPERTYPAQAGSQPTQPRRTSTVAAEADDPLSGRLGMAWLVIPAALLSLIILVPVTVALISWRRGVRAEREYRRRRSASGGSSVGS